MSTPPPFVPDERSRWLRNELNQQRHQIALATLVDERVARQIVALRHHLFPLTNLWLGADMRVLLERFAYELSAGRKVFVGEEIRCKGDWCRDSAGRWGIWCSRVNVDGRVAATLRCLVCGLQYRHIGATNVINNPALLPVWSDSTSPHPCERCGSINGTQRHHWAPWHLFDDAESWPTAHLCIPCHQLWHERVTPNMHRKKTA